MSHVFKPSFKGVSQACIILIVFTLLSNVCSGQKSNTDGLVELNDGALKSIYLNNIAKENYLIINRSNLQANSFESVRSIRPSIKDSRQNAQAIEITNLADFFRRGTNFTLANDIVDLFFPSFISGATPKDMDAILESSKYKFF